VRRGTIDIRNLKYARIFDIRSLGSELCSLQVQSSPRIRLQAQPTDLYVELVSLIIHVSGFCGFLREFSFEV
jgi:hypothetical protein